MTQKFKRDGKQLSDNASSAVNAAPGPRSIQSFIGIELDKGVWEQKWYRSDRSFTTSEHALLAFPTDNENCYLTVSPEVDWHCGAKPELEKCDEEGLALVADKKKEGHGSLKVYRSKRAKKNLKNNVNYVMSFCEGKGVTMTKKLGRPTFFWSEVTFHGRKRLALKVAPWKKVLPTNWGEVYLNGFLEHFGEKDWPSGLKAEVNRAVANVHIPIKVEVEEGEDEMDQEIVLPVALDAQTLESPHVWSLFRNFSTKTKNHFLLWPAPTANVDDNSNAISVKANRVSGGNCADVFPWNDVSAPNVAAFIIPDAGVRVKAKTDDEVTFFSDDNDENVQVTIKFGKLSAKCSNVFKRKRSHKKRRASSEMSDETVRL